MAACHCTMVTFRQPKKIIKKLKIKLQSELIISTNLCFVGAAILTSVVHDLAGVLSSWPLGCVGVAIVCLYEWPEWGLMCATRHNKKFMTLMSY
jgi:1,4-dihydroxy-2-naphthoate octaprenyltransferase